MRLALYDFAQTTERRGVIMAVRDKNISKFISKWQGRGKEKQDDQAYWTDVLSYIVELTDITNRIEPQKDVIGPDGNTKWIDIYIPETKVIIEQKSLNIDLSKPQAGHDGMTPYEQAKMYDNCLVRSEKARWIVTSNFAEIWIYDMEAKKPEDTVVKVSLDNLQREYKQLSFLYDPHVEQIIREFEISKEAGNKIGTIYEALLKQYPKKPTEDDLKNLNSFCVRLVFCYYAEDAGLFEDGLFSNYMKSFNPQHLRTGLKELFRILNTKYEDRDPFEEKVLLDFPYVNGGLFDGRNNVIPQIDEKIKDILISAADFDWSDISPTIFGAIFESTLNQDTRRDNGMHYTAIENIHKVIDPLFLNDLKSELEDIKASKQPNVRVQKLHAYQDKLASLAFLDPACGSGNFLTETYISLRRLENDVIATLNRDQMEFIGAVNSSPIKVRLDQFNGIEINDFAVSVARTAMWIAENQMMEKTKEIIVNADSLNFLPLSSFTKIREANALQVDWNDIVSVDDCNYIMGNPPFVGARLMKKEQKADVAKVFDGWKKIGNLDYVSCWFKKCSDYIRGTKIKAALVSTNSITQGESVSILWEPLFNAGLNISFAHRTFRWDSEATIKAHVHCVIIGFQMYPATGNKYIYDKDTTIVAKNINAYLLDYDNVFVKNRTKPLSPSVPNMLFGNMANDDKGKLSNYSTEEKDAIVKHHPNSVKLFRKVVGSEEYINNIDRWCIWLKDVAPEEYINIPPIVSAISAVKKARSESDRDATRKLAKFPMLFGEIRQPDKEYLLIPRTSSENYRYVPMGFVASDIIANDATLIVPDAELYHFAILTSSVNMAWMKVVAGRLKSDYRYSAGIVYNNFPWCSLDDSIIAELTETAKNIIKARENHPNLSLADLYGERYDLFTDLVDAHEANDKAVLKAYGFKTGITDFDIVVELMKMYQNLV